MSNLWFDISQPEEDIEKEILNSEIHENILNDNEMSIDNIMKINYRDLNESNILKYQTTVSIYLKKCIAKCKMSNDEIDVNSYIQKLEWLYETSDFLAKSQNLKNIQHKKISIDKQIMRNSYEFCDYGNLCTNNKMGKCKKKHFVYNYICSDIEETIKYLKNEQNICIDELYRTINTINYVFNHMHNEISSIHSHDFIKPSVICKVNYK